MCRHGFVVSRAAPRALDGKGAAAAAGGGRVGVDKLRRAAAGRRIEQAFTEAHRSTAPGPWPPPSPLPRPLPFPCRAHLVTSPDELVAVVQREVEEVEQRLGVHPQLHAAAIQCHNHVVRLEVAGVGDKVHEVGHAAAVREEGGRGGGRE